MKHGPKLDGARGTVVPVLAVVSTMCASNMFLRTSKKTSLLCIFVSGYKMESVPADTFLFAHYTSKLSTCILLGSGVLLRVYAFMAVEAALSRSSQAGEQPKRKSKRKAHGNALSRALLMGF